MVYRPVPLAPSYLLAIDQALLAQLLDRPLHRLDAQVQILRDGRLLVLGVVVSPVHVHGDEDPHALAVGGQVITP